VDAAERTTGSLFTARGCPYGCYFCADARTKLREESLEQIEAEVKALAEIGVTALRVWDDTITIKEKRCRDMADIFHNYGMLWRGWSPVNLMNPELFKYLAARGCTEMGFGVEHGSARMLKAMNKGTTPEANAKGIKICQDAGIVARAYLLIGFPGETWESIEEMRLWLETARPDAASLHMFQPYPGSQVWATPERFGIALPENAFSQMWELNDDDPKTLVLDLPTMTKEELFQARTELHEWIVDNISLRLANR
jgi:anaerobic magnesium-protoporphyrin IX monomethyl ester cyclase